MDWFECKQNKIVKGVSVDGEFIQSLLMSSQNKATSEQLLPLSDETAGSKISLAYDSLRELLEALALRKGLKIYNHECYTAFLKEVIKDSLLGEEFDEVRKIRNAINYYGKNIRKQECVAILKQIKTVIERVKKYL